MNTAEQIQEYQHIPLNQIRPSQFNARKFDNMTPEKQKKFDELVASVQAQDVIQPITVRPVENGLFEIVAGERRYRASTKVAEIEGVSTDVRTIPATVRLMTDAEAIQVMATENLHRQDFDAIEEASFFSDCLKSQGNNADTLKALSKTYGLDAGAIRLRIALLDLPEAIQNAYNNGQITIGHADQLVKISDKQFQLECFNATVANRWTIKELAAQIKTAKPKLSWARFDTSNCAACLHNSNIQRSFFEQETDSHCLKSDCFREKQFNFFRDNWRDSKGKELFGTCAFIFHDDLPTEDLKIVEEGNVHDRCLECPEYATVGTLAGNRVEGKERVCLGDSKCYESCYAAKDEDPPAEQTTEAETETTVEQQSSQQQTPAKSDSKQSKEDKEKRLKQRAEKRGEDVREAIFKDSLAAVMNATPTSSPPAVRMALTALMLASSAATDAVAKAADTSISSYDNTAIADFVLAQPKESLLGLLLSAATGTIMGGSGGMNGSNPAVRQRISSLVNFDIAQHWQIDQKYLDQLTKEEIFLMGEEDGTDLWNDEKIKAYREENHPQKGWMSLKKGDLIDAVLKSGADLTGKVPKEILGEL